VGIEIERDLSKIGRAPSEIRPEESEIDHGESNIRQAPNEIGRERSETRPEEIVIYSS